VSPFEQPVEDAAVSEDEVRAATDRDLVDAGTAHHEVVCRRSS